MNANSSKQSEGQCSVCGSPASLQPAHHDKESGDWYASQLEWALESSVLIEWICHNCDHLLKTTDQLETELSAVLAALQQRYVTGRDLRRVALNHAAAGPLLTKALNSTDPNQADRCSLGPGDVLISIWTDQRCSEGDHPARDAGLVSADGSGDGERDPSDTTQGHPEALSETRARCRPEELSETVVQCHPKALSETVARAKEEKTGAEPKQGSRSRPTTELPPKMTVCLSCDDCSRTFSTVCSLARHRRRAHRRKTPSGSCDAVDDKCGAKSADQQQHQSAAEDGDGMKARTEASMTNSKRVDVRKAEVESGQLMTLADTEETAGADVCAAGHTGNVSEHGSDTDSARVVPPTSATGAAESRGVIESPAVASDGSDSFRDVGNRVSIDAAYTEPSALYVSKELSWFQTESSEVDLSTQESRTTALRQPGPECVPVSSVVFTEAADSGMTDGQRLPQPDSYPASESTSNTDTGLEHGEFRNSVTELSIEVPGTEPMEVSTTSAASERLTITDDRNQELSISLDTDVALSPTTPSNPQQKSHLTSTTDPERKNVTDSATDSLCAVNPTVKPPYIHRKVVQEASPATEKAQEASPATAKAQEASPATEKAQEASPATEKRSVDKRKAASPSVEKASRRPRLTLYQRQGEKWRCLQCSALFATRAGAHGHSLTHCDPDGGRCPRCGKTYANVYALRRHRAGCLSGRPPSCPVCGKIVADAAYLAQHVLSHSKDAPKKHQCDRCGLAFAVGARLRAHIAVEHSGETPHRCDICRREFKLQVQLRRHLGSVHAAVPVVTCEVCGKGFNRADHLRAHRTVHTGARPFVCTECGRGFTRADTLTEHGRLHTGEKPFRCAQCGEAFREHRGYKRHLKVKHGDKSPGNPPVAGGITATGDI